MVLVLVLLVVVVVMVMVGGGWVRCAWVVWVRGGWGWKGKGAGRNTRWVGDRVGLGCIWHSGHGGHSGPGGNGQQRCMHTCAADPESGEARCGTVG